jgi:orotidine-5'-phosphate decarboxylase
VRAEGGVFVVVRSSNPEGRELQTARMANGETVAQNLCREITLRNRKQGAGLGYIGAVVGATCDDAAETVAALPQSFILAPGVGAQGATLQDVLKRMPSARGRVLPNVSRAILANGGTVADIRTTIRGLQEQARELL